MVDFDEVWRPVLKVIYHYQMDYDAAVTLGGQFGILTAEIERLQAEIEKLNK